MAIQQKTFTIKGTSYHVTQLPASKGFKVLKALGKILGPAMAEISKAEENSLSVAVDKIFESLDEVPVEAMINEMINSVSKDNMAINFDTEFAGEYDKLFELIKEIVGFNFGSVFTLLGSKELV